MKISSAVKVVAVSALVLFGLTLSSCKACDKNKDKNEKGKYESKVCMPGNVDAAVDIANGDDFVAMSQAPDAHIDIANGDDFVAMPQVPAHIAPATVYDAIDNLKNKTKALIGKIDAIKSLIPATDGGLWCCIARGIIGEVKKTVHKANCGVLVAEEKINEGYWQHAWDRENVVRRSKESKEKRDAYLNSDLSLGDEIKKTLLAMPIKL